MSIEIGQDLLTYGQAAQLLPKGSRPSYSTFWRWWNRGIRGVKLETVLVGGKRYTTAAAMQRFAEALSGREQTSSPNASRTAARRRNARSTEDALRRHNVL